MPSPGSLRRARAESPAPRVFRVVAAAAAWVLVATVLTFGAAPASAAAPVLGGETPAPTTTAEPGGTPVADEEAAADDASTAVAPSDPSAPTIPEPDADDAAVSERSGSTTPAETDSPEGLGETASPEPSVEPSANDPPLRAARALGDISVSAAGIPEAPVQVWTEGFENNPVNAATRLGDYRTASGGAYTGAAYWLNYANCNGIVVNYNANLPVPALGTSFPAGLCNSNVLENATAQLNVRRLADVTGQVALGVTGGATAGTAVNGSTAATRANHAVGEWTMLTNGTANQIVLESSTGLGVSPATPRYYTATIDVSEASCGTASGANNSRLALSLVNGTTERPLTSVPLQVCTDAAGAFYASPLPAAALGWGTPGDSVRGGRLTADTAVQLTPAQVGAATFRVRNQVAAADGNNAGVDNLRLLDATPSLDVAFGPDLVVAGTPTTLTYTVTNTSELAAKPDWSFTNALPSGVVVAPTPGIGGTCTNTTGTAFAVTAAAGAASIAAVGGDLAAGASSCTITVNVVASTPGTYVNGAANVTTVLNAPDAASVVVEAPTRITIQKNVVGRAAVADQFRLALSSGATEIASATTVGSVTGLQPQRVGPINVARGATYTISETIVSAASLNTYTPTYQCVRGTTTIATGTSISGPITIPDEPGAEIVCTFTNTPQPASLYCDGTYFYAVRSNGSIAQVNSTSTAAPTQLVGAVTGATDVNALGVSGVGSSAIAVDRTTAATTATGVVNYTITAGGALQGARTALTTAQGAFLDRSGAALDGAIIAGAVDPLNGRYLVGKSATGSVRLWEYTPTTTTNGSRFLYLGQVATGTAAGENGDISFDAQGNLHIVQTAADSSNVGMFSVTRESLAAASGGTLPASATVRRALSGTDAGNALTSVNGMAFSPTGTVYLGNGTLAYQFDPTTWVRVPGSPRATIGTTTIGATDLAACSSPSTLSIEKNVVGRVNAADQFRLTLSAGSPLAESSVATTTGSTTGVQAARIGPTPVQINTSVTIAETMAAGSVSPLTAYTSVYECWADGVRIFTGTEKSAAITIPNRLSVGVACAFSNSPAPFATVRVTKIVEDWAGGNRTPTPGWTMTAAATANTGSTVSILPSRNPAQQTGADGSATWQVLFGAASNRGRVTVAETTQTGFRYQSLVCTVNGATGATTVTTVGDQVRGALNVDIAPGNIVDCVYTNRPVATLSLVKNVSYGGAPVSSWQLAATRSSTSALPGPAGAGGSGTLNAVTVSADTAYRLSEAGGPATYVQVGAWSCVTATGASVPVTPAGDVTLARATAVTCTVTNATASLVLLKNVQNPSTGFQPSTWNLTAAPATLAGLSATTVRGADFSTTGNGNAANTFDVRPGHSYTLSEALAQSGTRLAYRMVRLEQRQSDGTWTPVPSATIAAPAAGQTAVYRFVNAPVQPAQLPLTGGASTDTFLLSGSVVLALALALAVWHGRRRSRRSAS